MQAILNRMLRSLVIMALILPGICFANAIGSGTLEGLFHDSAPLATAPFISAPNTLLPLVSQGSGSSNYQWGLSSVQSRYFLDGVETPVADITALNLSADETLVRVTAERLISNNSLSFTPMDFSDQVRGEVFVAGVIEYSNGVAALGTSPGSVLFTLNSFSTDPDFTKMLELVIGIESTPNVLDANGLPLDLVSADFIFFVDYPEFGSFRVYEDHSTSIEILMSFDPFQVTGFGMVADPDAGFTSPSTGLLRVPTPATLSLFVLGLWIMRRRS